MSSRLPFILLFAFIALRADTLTLRNGSSVRGTWIDLNDRQVTFRANNHVQTYDRSEVAGITFGREATRTDIQPSSNPAPLPTTPETSSREPETIGAVFFQDAAGKLVPLERRTLYEQRVDQGAGAVANNGDAAAKYWEMEEAASTVRLKVGPKMIFVVRLANGIDPASWDLYPLQAVKDGRRLQAHSRNKTALLTVLTTVTKFGESSYGITPEGKLAPGEYAFSSKALKDAYCFAIEAQ
jgi:hypothetical protein